MDRTEKEARFAWGLYYDCAFLRSLASFGFDTMEEAVAAGGIEELAEGGLQIRCKHAPMTMEKFVDLSRWPMHEDFLSEQIKAYEEWIWQLTRPFLYNHGDDMNAEIFTDLRKALAWQLVCLAQRDHFRATVQDTMRHKTGVKMTLKQIRDRVYFAKGTCGYEEHPDYPDDCLTRSTAAKAKEKDEPK